MYAGSKMSCSVLPEHFLHVGSVKIRFIYEMFKVNGLQVDGLLISHCCIVNFPSLSLIHTGISDLGKNI